jgi:hypothetical protein
MERETDHESRAIDVSGLSADAVQAIESLVAAFRRKEERHIPSLSVFDLFGKAPKLRTGEDISRQISEERDAWGKG